MLNPSRVVIAALIAVTATAGKDPALRNLALNPHDVHEAGHGYPHASSNSETRGEACFWAINAIDGRTDNRGHGPKFPSWGPEKRTDLWWRVDFGKVVEVEKVVERLSSPMEAWSPSTFARPPSAKSTISYRGTPPSSCSRTSCRMSLCNGAR